MPAENLLPCFYCEQSFDFNEEHVVPACIGGDDRRWMLRDCVCKNCNHYFSRLEAEFARSSPLALARLMSQAKGRDRGKRTTDVSFRARELTFVDGEGLIAEVKLGPQFVPTVRAQVAWTGDNALKAQGSDRGELDLLLSKLRGLAEAISLVSKDDMKRFHIIPVRFAGTSALIDNEAQTIAERPPSLNTVWLQTPLQEEKGFRPYVMLGDSKQLVCRARGADEGSKLLALARAIGTTVSAADGLERRVEKPSLHMKMSINVREYNQVVAKIGLNLYAYLFGHHSVRGGEFSAVRDYIKGKGEENAVQGFEALPRVDFFQNGPLEGLHMLMLTPVVNEGHVHIVFAAYLYGTPQLAIQLGRVQNCPPQRHQIVMVKYKENVIYAD